MNNKSKNNYIIVNEVPDEYKYTYIGTGCSGRCYITKDGDVYKEFNHNLISSYFLKIFTEVKCDSIVFPKELVYLKEINDDHLIGYKMDYVRGTLLKDLEYQNISITDYINALDKVENDIKDISLKSSIQIDDINPGNVIYTKEKEFKIIDTDFYSCSYSESPLYVYKSNLREWGNLVLSIIGYNYPFEDYKLNIMFESCIFNGKVKPSHIIYELYNRLNQRVDYPIETLEDYNKNLKLLKKVK